MLYSLITVLAMAGAQELSAPAADAADTLASQQAQSRQVEPRRVQPRQVQPRRVSPVRAAIASQFSIDAFHDPQSLGWYSHRNLTNQRYSDLWNKYKDDGFVPIDIEMDTTSRGVRYSGVWQKNTDGRGWVSYRNLSSNGFHQRWEEYKDKGYRPIDQDAVVINGSVRYSFIMVQNKEGVKWASFRNLTSAQFSERFEQYKGSYFPIDVDAWRVNGQMRYSIIWVENKTNKQWAEWRDMTPETYGQKFQQYSNNGYRVAELDCYANTNGQLRYAAVWEKNPPGRGWAARREMSSQWYSNYWKRYRDQGMRAIDVERCPAKSGSGSQYAGVWRENDARFDWSGRSDAEDALEDYVGDANVPGVGAAIIRNGEVIFRGGWGFADEGNSKWANSDTIYRLASVAKAVTGVLAYDMEEAGIIDLDDDTDTLVSGLGNQHDHTVRDLLRNESCVNHYTANDGFNDNGTQTSYATAQNALDNHLGGAIKTNTWIISGCTAPTWNYSTHGYTIAAAALEEEGGTSFSNLVRTRLANPFGLSSLRVESRTSPASSGDLARLYNSDGSAVSNSQFQNVTWKAGGSGMESSAYHLALFGDAVLRNRYFPQATRDVMWVGSANGQANGWAVSGGIARKGGDNQASDTHIRIDINNGVTVVALTNLNPPDVETSTLTQDLLDIANAN